MTSYQIDPDGIFSDGDSSPVHHSTPSPKRPRTMQEHVPTRAPSLGPLKLKLPDGSMARADMPQPSRPAITAIAPPVPTRPYGGPPSSRADGSMRHGPGTYQRDHHGRGYRPRAEVAARHVAYTPQQNRHSHTNNAHHRDTARHYHQDQNGYLQQGRGRGRTLTLPAHITRGAGSQSTSGVTRFNSNKSSIHGGPPQVAPTVAENEPSVPDASSILPQASRERLLSAEKKTLTERKPVGRRRIPPRSALAEERDRKVVMRNVQLAQDAQKSRAANTVLQSLMKASQRATEQGLIRLGSKRGNGSSSDRGESNDSTPKRRKRMSEYDIYAGITMTKEQREREERERLAQEQRIREERERIVRHYKDLRAAEREERAQLLRTWKKVETVAAVSRDSYHLEHAERWLFASKADVSKRDSLNRFGLALKPIEPVDDYAASLLTVEVIEI